MWRRWLVALLVLLSTSVDCGYSQQLVVTEFSYEKVALLKRFGHKEEGDVGRKKCRVVDMYAPDDSCKYELEQGDIKLIKGDGYTRLVLDKGVSFFKISHPSYGSFYWKMPLKKLKRWRGYKAVLASPTFKEYKPNQQWLVMTTNPKECIVRVDTVYKRLIDGRLQMQLPLGGHAVEVQSPFFESFTDSITLSSVETKLLRVELKPIYSYLSIDCGEDQAVIYVDGRAVGRGSTERLRLTPGSREIKVEEVGYEPQIQIVELAEQQSRSLKIEYARKPLPEQIPSEKRSEEVQIAAADSISQPKVDVQVSVKGFDERCDIYVNNELYGRGTWSGVLSEGLYLFANQRDGLSSKPIYVEIGDNPSVHVELASPLSAYGVVNISSSVAGAEIYIDGKFVGKSPMIIPNLDADREYRFTLQLQGYHTQQQIVRVKANSEVKVDFKLKK